MFVYKFKFLQKNKYFFLYKMKVNSKT